MIITLKGADFSASNIGTLSSWRISRSLGAGATYEGVTSVDKGAAFSATVTLAEGYELGTAGVTITMGGTVLSGAHSIEGNVITITIASVTGNVLIKVPTINTAGSGEVVEEVWYMTDATDVMNNDETKTLSDLAAANGAYAYLSDRNALLQNKPINAVKMVVSSAGTLSFGTWKQGDAAVNYVDTITLENADTTKTQTYKLNTTITLEDDEFLIISQLSDTGKFKFVSDAKSSNITKYDIYYKLPTATSTLTGTKRNLMLDIGYMPN